MDVTNNVAQPITPVFHIYQNDTPPAVLSDIYDDMPDLECTDCSGINMCYCNTPIKYVKT